MTTKSRTISGLPKDEPALPDAETNKPVDATDAEPSSTVDDGQVKAMSDNPDDYEYVRLPNGMIHAVRKDSIRDVHETSTQDTVVTEQKAKEEDHFYVHLADGSVERVKESDLPTPAGTNAMNGHWQRDGKVYQVIGVYPVEDTV